MKTLSSFSLSFSFLLCALCGSLQARDFPVPNAKISGTSEVSAGSTFAIKGIIDFTDAEAITGLPTASDRVIALNGLSGGANYLPYFTDTNSLGQLSFTAFSQSLLPLSSSSAWLNAIMPSSPTTGDIAQWNGTAWVKVSLGSLATGIPKITTATGAITIATPGTDYVVPGSFLTSGLTVPSGYLLGRATTTTGAPEVIIIGSGLTLDPATATLSSSGGGDLSGPASAVDSRLALFDSTTGKLIKQSSSLTEASGIITSNGPIGLAAGGTNQSVTITPSGSGFFICPRDTLIYSNGGSYSEGLNVFAQPANGAGTGQGMNFHIGAPGTGPSSSTLKGYFRVKDNGDFIFNTYSSSTDHPGFVLDSAGSTFSVTRALKVNLGAGTLVTDSGGNVTASSDARLKNIDGDFTRGLVDLRKLSPKLYHWRPESGLDPVNQYAGLIAQDVQAAIPEAVGSDAKGTLSLNDRPLIAALINATKELDTRVSDLERQCWVLAGVAAMFCVCTLLLTTGRKKCCRE